MGVHSRQRGPLEGFGAPFLNYERAMIAEAGAGTASYPSPIFSAVAIATAFAWWAVLFPSVVANTGLTFGEAVPCVASNSQLCELETALCHSA